MAERDAELKIESGIPLPMRGGATNKGFSDVLRKLNVGQSTLLPTNHNSARSVAARILGSGNFRSSKTDGGTRIWRIK